MTIFKLFKLDMSGLVTTELVEAYDWNTAILNNQYGSTAVLFKIEAIGTTEPATTTITGEQHV